ncbi:MAG: universal stress protein [Halobacteria archaeon]|nr:universal stress protein [Halobacteria archaeon]
MYSNILIPTDGSEGTHKAVEHAIDIAQRYDAALHVLYVVNTSAYSTLPADTNWQSVIEALEKEGKRAVKEIEEKVEDSGLKVHRSIQQGVPHKTILEYAEENDIDMIVMGTHGKTGIDRLLLGSVTEKVVRSSEIPVLTVRMTESHSGE